LPVGKRKPPAAAGYSAEPHVFVSTDTAKKALSFKPDKVMNIATPIRVNSWLLHTQCAILNTRDQFSSTSIERALQIGLYLQNKPNIRIGKMNVSAAKIKDYHNEQPTINNEPHSKQTQTKPISSQPKMSANKVLTEDYESQPACGSKSNQTQFQSQKMPLGMTISSPRPRTLTSVETGAGETAQRVTSHKICYVSLRRCILATMGICVIWLFWALMGVQERLILATWFAVAERFSHMAATLSSSPRFCRTIEMFGTASVGTKFSSR
jgi:hypothetical protein